MMMEKKNTDKDMILSKKKPESMYCVFPLYKVQKQTKQIHGASIRTAGSLSERGTAKDMRRDSGCWLPRCTQHGIFIEYILLICALFSMDDLIKVTQKEINR